MPISPGATGASFDVLLAFSLDAEANRRVQTGVSTMEAELKRLQEEAKGVGDSYKKGGEEVKKTSKDVSKELIQEARIMKREAAAITDDLKAAQISALKNVSSFIGGISQSALLAGTAIAGGIFAEVNHYIGSAKEATEATTAWKRETDSLSRSRTRVDEVLAREALPLLQQAAKVANQAAGFIEKHPDIVQAALKTGVVLAGLGAIGTAVSKGIKIVADISALGLTSQNLAAAKLQDIAADKQLAAAQLRAGKEVSIPGGSTGGGGLGTAGQVIGTATLAITTAVIAFKSVDFVLEKLGQPKTGDMFKAELDFIKRIPDVLTGKIKLNDLAAEVVNAARATAEQRKETKELGTESEKTAQSLGRLAGSANESKIVDAFTKWKEDDRRLVQEAADNRKKIIEEGEKAIADITKRYTDQRASITAQSNERRAEIVSSFNEENIRAEEELHKSQAEAKKNETEELAKIEQDRQERLRQISKDGAERLGELEGNRDAHAYEKEKQRIEGEKEEANRSASRAAAQVKQETSARLAELATQYAAEQAQRQAKFIQDLAQNEAQKQAELKQAAEAYQAEIKQARDAQSAKLRELQEGLNAERIRRREVMIAEIKDLDSSLLGERNLKSQYYQLMLKDAEAFFARYRASLPSGSTSTTQMNPMGPHDYTGYAYSGLYAMAQNGKREFVLGGDATRAAERMIGGTLSQSNVLRALAMGGGGSVEYNDYRRMDGPTSKDERRLFQQAAEAAILTALGAR